MSQSNVEVFVDKLILQKSVAVVKDEEGVAVAVIQPNKETPKEFMDTFIRAIREDDSNDAIISIAGIEGYDYDYTLEITAKFNFTDTAAPYQRRYLVTLASLY